MATELRSVPVNATNALLDRRLHDIGWGLLLMLTGMIWLVPAERVPEGAWLLGVAAILLGVNVVRYLKHITVSGFSLVLGLRGAPCRVQPDLAHGLAGAGDLSPHHRREPRGQAPSDEDHVTATAGGHP